MADQHDAATGFFLVRLKTATKFWTDPECGEEVPRDNLALDVDGLIEAAQSEPNIVVRHQVCQRMVSAPPIEEIRIRQSAKTRGTSVDRFCCNQPLRLV